MTGYYRHLLPLLAVLSLLAGHAPARAEENTASRSVLGALERYEQRVEGLLLKRVATKQRIGELSQEIDEGQRQREAVTQTIRDLKTHLGRQVRRMYLNGGLNWLGELVSGHDMVALTLRRAYLSRFASTTDKLLTRLKDADARLERQQQRLKETKAALKELEGTMLAEEEMLRSESEKSLALLMDIRRDQRRRARLTEELSHAENKLNLKMRDLSRSRLEPLAPHFSCRCPAARASVVVGYHKPLPDDVLGVGLSRGVWLLAAPGATALAPVDGEVVFSSRFKGFGEMVIISVAKGVHVVLAHLSARTVAPGQQVKTGDEVGLVSPSGRMYLEIRHRGEPLDPAPYLNCP